ESVDDEDKRRGARRRDPRLCAAPFPAKARQAIRAAPNARPMAGPIHASHFTSKWKAVTSNKAVSLRGPRGGIGNRDARRRGPASRERPHAGSARGHRTHVPEIDFPLLCWTQLPTLIADPTDVNVWLALPPSVVMAPMQTTMIKASMTAYSTAVGPS